MKRTRVAILAVVLVAVAGVGWFLLHPQKTTTDLVLQGNVDVRQADFSFKVGGRIEGVLVQEGDKVAAGQIIAQLEKTEYQAKLDGAEADVTVAEAALAELEHGSRPEEIDQARAQVDDYEAQLANLRLTYRRQQDLLKSGNTPQSSFDLADTNLRQTLARLANAKAALALAVIGPRREKIDAARGQLASARAARALARQNLADTTLSVPEDGVVLSRVREPGTVANAGDVIFSVVLAHPTWVRAYVTEPDLERVGPGMTADILTDGGRHYAGRVGYISPLAEFTPKTVQTPEQRSELVYRLRVVVDAHDDGLRQGMPVSVRLAVTEKGPT